MSGGPPHHPHNRQNPSANSAWNHLQVPNFYPRQPLHAHLSTDPAAAALLHQVPPTWHVPTAEPLMKLPSSLQSAHHHLFNLEQMVAERQQQQQQHHVFPRDLSSPRNGSGVQQNGGDLPLAPQPPHTPPISLSVRDTNKINSMPASALEINVKSTSPSLKCISPAALSASQQASPKATASGKASMTLTTQQMQHHQQQRLATKRGVDSILERLNPPAYSQLPHPAPHSLPENAIAPSFERPAASTVGPLPSNTGSVYATLSAPVDSLQASINAVAMGVGLTGHIGVSGSAGSGSQHDENSNSSSILLNVPTPTNAREDDVVSPYSNDDNSLDSNKSRRKRKPCKTMRVNKDILPATVPPPSSNSPAVSDLLLKQAAEMSAIPGRPESQPIVLAAPTAASTHSPQPLATTATLPTEIVTSSEPIHNTVDNNTPRSDVPLENKIPERRKSITPPLRKTSRRKASSETETIANIAAMVQEMQPKTQAQDIESIKLHEDSKISEPQSDAGKAFAQSDEKVVEAPFREVENKLEEMFAGLEDTSLTKPCREPLDDALTEFSKMGFDNDKDLLKLESNNTLTSTPETDASLRRATRSTGEVLLDSSIELSARNMTPSSSRRRKKMARKSPKRSKSASRYNAAIKSTTKVLKKTSKSGLTTPVSLASSLASKLSSDIKDVVANSYDSGSNASSSKSRGPFIQIKGPRDSPHSVCIVNSSTTDGDDHQGTSGASGVFGGKTGGKTKFHDDSEYRQRVRVRGLHCSTLSNKYDAQTRDATWICAFCKRGPHAAPPITVDIEKYPPPGDLFGPYVITTACAEYQRRLDDPYDKQFKSKKVCRSLEAVPSTSKANIVRGGRGSRRKTSESHGGTLTSPTSGVVIPTDDLSPVTCEQSIMLGITLMPDTDPIHTPGRAISSRTTTGSINTTTSTTCYEVWAHEDCIVWSAGVYLAGGGARIVGLEAAVWASSGVTCVACGLRGANVCCMRRGCARAQHYGCARVGGWALREQDYAAFCTEHLGLTSRGTTATATSLHNGDTKPCG